jgi:hypothetical protein
MSQQTLKTFRAAEKTVTKLIEICSKTGPLYSKNPKAVAQVSRTGKWLLNAITALQRELDLASQDTQPQS